MHAILVKLTIVTKLLHRLLCKMLVDAVLLYEKTLKSIPFFSHCIMHQIVAAVLIVTVVIIVRSWVGGYKADKNEAAFCGHYVLGSILSTSPTIHNFLLFYF
jgi:hypothetical protein